MMTGQKRARLTKDDVNSWFEERQTENRSRREEKVTAEDIERRLIERKAARDTSRRGRFTRVLPVAVGTTLLIVAGGISVTTSDATQVFKSESEVVAHQIAAAQADLAALPVADEGTAGEYAAALEEQLATAQIAGQEVAALQQEYSTIIFQGNEENAIDGPVLAHQAATEHQQRLVGYFTEQSLIAADGSSPEEGEVDPRHPWHVGYEDDGLTVVDPKTSTWELVSMVATTKTPATFEATWLNRGEEGELYAWATASYLVDAGKFASLTVGQTTLGTGTSSQISPAGE